VVYIVNDNSLELQENYGNRVYMKVAVKGCMKPSRMKNVKFKVVVKE